ncbi:hypothetical protein RHSIM_Rhsim02G0072700 [Rhododendron simsii]|uniref:Aminotransferase-like plant mobile domain-containing protein n=1 Tax=Rhododendron simsii TaxID=118357 RepID=A0A834LWF0_RHOSS|nr:hypothetical protein RHSIM_Rhsim02G0072700 [Rhododendron simsii]
MAHVRRRAKHPRRDSIESIDDNFHVLHPLPLRNSVRVYDWAISLGSFTSLASPLSHLYRSQWPVGCGNHTKDGWVGDGDYHKVRMVVIPKKREEEDVKEETNLAALLSCSLCVFVLPNKEVYQIRPGVFKVASMMAQGKRFSLAVPVLASIYHGLREITSLPNPSKCGAAFPIHYVYGWLGRYYDSYFLSASTKFECGARMVRLAGEKKAKHFSFQEACDLLKCITPSTLSLLALGKPQQGIVTDHGKHSDSSNDYVVSLKSSYLTLHRGNEHIVEPYSPHRFARQFRFCQDTPGKLREELSTGTLDAIYQLWESCTRLNTRADFTIPSHSSKGLATKEYVEWWEKSSSNFYRDKLACEKPKSPLAVPKGKNVITLHTMKSKLATEVTPPSSKSKEKEVTKAVTKERSSSDKGERHWKRLKKKAADSDSRLKEKVMVSDLAKLDYNLDGILDDLPDTSNHVELENQFASDEREGSVDGPDPFDLALQPKHNFVFGAIHLPSTSKPSTSKPPMLGRAATSTVTAFDTGSMISCGRLLAAKIYDNNIKSILGKTPFEKLTSLRPKLQVICAEFLKLELDYSPLQTQVENYTQNTANYVSMRSNFASRMTSEVKERRLADVDTKRSQLMEELDQLDLEVKKLRESLEGIDAQRTQKQHGVSTLQEEQAIIEATEVMEPADMEVANNLEQLLKSELEEIQNLAWLD